MAAHDSLADLDLPGRVTRVRPRMEALAAAVGGAAPRLDDGAFFVAGTLSGSRRPFRIVARLEPDQFEIVGEVELEVEVDNRLGYIFLVHDDEPELDRMTSLAGELCVHDADPEHREAMVELVGRVPWLTGAVESFLRTFERYGLELCSDRIVVAAGDLDDEDEDWQACVASVASELAELDAIARRFEELPVLDHATCAYCGARFLITSRARCLHCAAPI